MKTRVAGAAIVLALAAAGMWWYARNAEVRQDLPAGALRGYNVLLVTIDTLRADRVGAYGSAAGLTPTLDRLAAEGLRFDTAHTHVPLTLPAHASLMSGRIPPRHGVRDNGTYRLDAAQPALAATLDSAGYQTAAFIGAFVLDARFGLARGFDLYDDNYGERPPAGRADVVERRAEQVTAPATAWLRSAQGPWFAWVHVYDPHEPYAAPEPFASRYASAAYDGEVAYTDHVLGRMLNDLQAAGRLDRTLLIVVSDHGEALGERGERTHGLFAYESTLRVPLIMWCRDRLRPAAITEPTGLVDIAPTILDLLGLPFSGADGRSLRPPLAGEEAGQALAQSTYFEALNANLTRNWAPLTGVISEGLKLIDLPIPELYDLRADPSEAQNLYARRPEDARRLERLLDSAAAADARAPGASIDADTAARLRSLGYVVSQAPAGQRRFTADDDPKKLVALDAALDEAMKVSGRGDHASAIAMLQDVLRTRPDLPVAYDRLAFVLKASGRLPEAIGVLEQAASKGFADGPALTSLGTMLGEAGQLDRSANVLEAAVKMNPQDLEAVANLGVLYLRMGRRDQAIETLQRALTADPTLGGARNTLAVAYAQAGDLRRAVEEWRQVALARPNDPDVLYNIGTALLQLERASEARPFLERFIAVAPPRYATDVERVRQMIAAMPR